MLPGQDDTHPLYKAWWALNRVICAVTGHPSSKRWIGIDGAVRCAACGGTPVRS